jgi:hypothetical protein
MSFWQILAGFPPKFYQMGLPPYPHVGTIHTRTTFTHIGISGRFAKRDGLSIIRKDNEILLCPGIVMALNILNIF